MKSVRIQIQSKKSFATSANLIQRTNPEKRTKLHEIHTSAEVVPTSAAHDLLDSTLRGGQLEWRSYDPVRTVVADSNDTEQGRIQERDKATNGPLDGHEGPRLYGNRNQQRRLVAPVLSSSLCSHTRCPSPTLHSATASHQLVALYPKLVHFYRFP